MKKKTTTKISTTEKIIGTAIAGGIIAPLSVIFELAKPKKHRHGGRWCRKRK